MAGRSRDLLTDLLEAQQRRVRIRRNADEVGELLGEENRQLELIEQRRVVDRPARPVHHVDGVLDAPGDGANGDAQDQHPAQRQGGAEAVQKQRRIVGHDAHAGHRAAAGGGRLVADVDLHRVQLRRPLPLPADGIGHQFADPPPRRLGRPALQVRDRRRQPPLHLLPPRGYAVGAGVRGHAAAAELVDDHRPCRRRLPQPRHATAPAMTPPAMTRRGCCSGGAGAGRALHGAAGRAVGVSGAGVDGEPAGGKHAGDQREQPRVVGGQDRAHQGVGAGVLRDGATAVRNQERHRAVGAQPAEFADVAHHLRQREFPRSTVPPRRVR